MYCPKCSQRNRRGNRMRGVYTLIIDLKETLSFNLKSLGNLSFEKGTWIYIGSAMGNGSTSLENRIARHFRS
ncbi:MAG: DUF123 domain-containing protein [Candidatus Thorarchaeota archaeon]